MLSSLVIIYNMIFITEIKWCLIIGDSYKSVQIYKSDILKQKNKKYWTDMVIGEVCFSKMYWNFHHSADLKKRKEKEANKKGESI